MRTILLVPLTALVAVVAGCGSEAREQAARSVPERDLTLVTQTSEVTIASPVETQQLRIQRRTVRRPKVRLAAVAAPRSAAVLAPAEPAAQPADPEPSPHNDRELLPGETVTLIPASSGPSTGPDEAEEFSPPRGRTMVVRGGGTCRGRGRGPGIGIATAPRPDFR